MTDFIILRIYDGGDREYSQWSFSWFHWLYGYLSLSIFLETALKAKGGYFIMPRNKLRTISKRIVLTVLILLLWRSLDIELITPSWQFKLSTVPSASTEQIQNLLK